MQMIFVLPDYYEKYPKACYGGWGKLYIVVSPDGRVLPCHGATQITTFTFENARDHSLEHIWNESPAFQAFRGDAWMREPCRSCPAEDGGFRRLPLSGVCAHGKRRQYRSGLHAYPPIAA